MKLHAVYARFYRSLNYDFMRAFDERYDPDPWDSTPDGDYPFVRVKLHLDITTVVGGNESGKTQVLRAIEAALTGKGYDRSDFCRYSRFFGVNKKIVKPEFGVLFSDISTEDVQVIERAIERKKLGKLDRVAVFRMNETPQYRLYACQDGVWLDPVHIKSPNILFEADLPVPFEIDATIPLPDSVPISFMVDGKPSAAVGRDILRSVWDSISENPGWFGSQTTVQERAAEIFEAFRPARKPTSDEVAAFELASKLLLNVAGLDRSLFVELQEAVRTKNGYANSIVDTINAELAKALDFPHWWSQDSRFELFVSLYEYDLVFMIRDRTSRSYGFDERSDGLKYFLSYFVQYLAHTTPSHGSSEILLMDEPDRFLSSSGQQDLLRIFDDFAHPKNPDRRPVQVVYVTHSPFLIDKNFADRIRVLDKGEHDEGTRVVTSVAANHYEPLRSAFGSFVAETTFIGNCNLMVEGASDQVLLAGASGWLAARGVASRDRLDLNKVTLVPAGGTRHIPYLVYLARGRDVEKPPVIVLLDSDKDGSDARKALQEGGAYGSNLIKKELVLQLGDEDLSEIQTDNPLGISGIEDIVPLEIAIVAADLYCREFVPSVDVRALSLDSPAIFAVGPDGVDSEQATGPANMKNRGLLKFLEKAISAGSGKADFHLDKVAFARSVVDAISERIEGVEVSVQAKDTAHRNFHVLSSALTKRQRQAERDETAEKISSRINRTKKDFTRTHSSVLRREDALSLIEDIGSQLDNSPEAERVRVEMASWTRRFDLDGEPRGYVEDYQGFIKAIQSLAYKGMRDSSSANPGNLSVPAAGEPVAKTH